MRASILHTDFYSRRNARFIVKSQTVRDGEHGLI